ncbi:MAG TPA: FGGY family carbohydrate kinase [Steroidobacteraceae bacterium]
MGDNVYLALDQGGHASRAIVFDECGELIAQAFAPIATHRPAPEQVEHDPEEIINSLLAATADVVERCRGLGRIVAAGLATQRSSIACWDRRTGRALSPVISWQDRRNAELVASLATHATDIHTLTGLVLSPHYGASKLRWCIDSIPAVSQAAAGGHLAFGPLSSFVLFRLLDERPIVVDPANASRTQLYNPLTREWSPELLALFGIEARHLPRPVSSRHAFGSVVLGKERVPLCVCTGDQSTVPFAFGPPRFDSAYVNVGTGAFIQRPLAAPLIAAPLLTSVVWSDAQRVTYVLEGTVNGASSALDWFSEAEGVDAHRMLASLDVAALPSTHPPLFLNGISGLGSPFWIPDFESRFVGNSTLETRFVALLDSILFLIRVNLDEMRHHGAALKQIVITGGIAGADVFCQRLAGLTSLPVLRHAEVEATARGLAYLIANQPASFNPGSEPRVFQPVPDVALLERFVTWLREMKLATGR